MLFDRNLVSAGVNSTMQGESYLLTQEPGNGF
jgi:hypothetical protein